MTKLKDNISAEEHKKFEEEKQRPYRLEITELESDCISIKSPIILSREQYDLIQKVCEISDQRLEQYIKDALITMIDTDLRDSTVFGKQVCDHLLSEWDPIKPK